MLLLELKEGNAFGYFDYDDEDLIAIKCKSFQIVPGKLTALPLLSGYYAMGNECVVYPIRKVEEFSNLMDIKLNKTLLKDVPSGMICYTGNQIGCAQKILVTDGMNISGRMVAPVGELFLMHDNEEIEDLGYAGIFLNEDDVFDEKNLFKRKVRICPNCEEFSLVEIEDPIDEWNDVTCQCANCRSIIRLCWSN